MPVPDIVFLSNLHQLHSRQRDLCPAGGGDADPTFPVVQLQRIEVRVEIFAPPLGAYYLQLSFFAPSVYEPGVSDPFAPAFCPVSGAFRAIILYRPRRSGAGRWNWSE